jgi:hypothetical protein
VKLNSLPHEVLLKLVEMDERAARLAKATPARMVRKLVQLGDHTHALGAQAEVAQRKLEAWTNDDRC